MDPVLKETISANSGLLTDYTLNENTPQIIVENNEKHR